MVHGSLYPGESEFTIERTNLAWAGWRRTLDIRVVGVRAVASGGRVVANVPEMSVGLSVRGLLRGIVAPTGIDVIGPAMRLERRETGELALALGDARGGEENANPEVINRLIMAVQSAPNPDRPVTYLRRIRILNAQLVAATLYSVMLFDDRLDGGFFLGAGLIVGAGLLVWAHERWLAARVRRRLKATDAAG